MLRVASKLRDVKQLSRIRASCELGVRSMADGEDHASTADLETQLKEKLGATHLDVTDTSGGCGASFSVAVVSPKFEGKNLLSRHRMVNVALQKEMQTIHALSIRKVQTQKEYDADKSWVAQ